MIGHKWWAVATCIALLAGPACAQPQGNDQESKTQQQNTQSEKTKPEPPKSDVGILPMQPKAAEQGAVQAEVYEPDCRKPKNQPDADLCVQRRVADAAEKTLQLTSVQTYAGIVGLLAVLVTLGVTAYTGKAAKMAAQAAIDAVGTERAWLSFQSINTIPTENTLIHKVNHSEAIIVNTSWINSGRSPAVRANIYIDHILLEMNQEIPAKTLESNPSSGIVGPGISVSSNYMIIYGEDLELFRSRQRRLIVWSRIDYGSIFFKDRIFHTAMCAEMTFNGTRLTIDGKIEPNIEIRIVGDFNSAT